MKLLAGLGNPGKKYLKSRHNLGFLFIEYLIRYYNWPKLKLNKSFQAQIAKTKLLGNDIVIALPQVYMNNSGQAIKKISAYYKIKAGDIIIVHDDIDLPFGKFKISSDSGSAGHLGVQSIINQLDTKDFFRLRVGIGLKERPDNFSTESFVLKNFNKIELGELSNIFELLNQELTKLIQK